MQPCRMDPSGRLARGHSQCWKHLLVQCCHPGEHEEADWLHHIGEDLYRERIKLQHSKLGGVLAPQHWYCLSTEVGQTIHVVPSAKFT